MTNMKPDGRYDEDEILIISGRVADGLMEGVLLDKSGVSFDLALNEDEYDRLRNLGADAAEVVMRAWTGPTMLVGGELPQILTVRMADAARNAIQREQRETENLRLAA